MVGFRRMLSYVLPHWPTVLAAALCSAVVSGVDGTFAWMVKDAVDDVFISGQRSQLVLISVGIAVLFLFRGGFTFAQNYLMSRVGGKIVRDLRDKLYSHMVFLPMSHYGEDTAGNMMSRVISDAGMLDRLLVTRIKDVFLNVGTIIVLMCIALYRRWDLTLMTVVVLPFAFYGVDRIGKRLKRVSKDAQIRMAHITESLSEGLNGIKVVKSYTMEGNEDLKFKDRSQSYYREYMRGVRLQEAASMLMELFGGFGIGFVIYYGGSLVVSGAISSGEFLSFTAAILMLFNPAKRLAAAHNGLQQARAYIERIDEVLDLPPEHDGTREAAPFAREIAFDHVTFRYPGREEYALRDVSLTVKKGEVVALVGRSGSGKTTLVDLLARFHMPGEGRILMDGVEINDLTARSLRGQIGTVSQEVVLFNDTIAGNIRFGNTTATAEDVERAARAAFAHEFIMDLPQGYDTGVGDAGKLLSGGQRQRISIARAVLKNPPILVLDEATSALDSQSERMVQQALDRLIEESGAVGDATGRKTIFVIAHRLSTIKRADRIVVLDQGRIAEVGSHAELLARPGIYRRLHQLQHEVADTVDLEDLADIARPDDETPPGQ
jgi:subfamily B ATP-binding cassette protein MsbA